MIIYPISANKKDVRGADVANERNGGMIAFARLICNVQTLSDDVFLGVTFGLIGRDEVFVEQFLHK